MKTSNLKNRKDVMEQNLNQKLESEIKKLIKDQSCYYCRGEQICIVKDIQVNLNEDYSTHMYENVKFNGSAEFGFLIPQKEKPDTLYSHHNFTGNAVVNNFEIIKVETPITINK